MILLLISLAFELMSVAVADVNTNNYFEGHPYLVGVSVCIEERDSVAKIPPDQCSKHMYGVQACCLRKLS
jgi:hypothetical protein